MLKLHEIAEEATKLNDLFLDQIDEKTGEIRDPQALEELEQETQNLLSAKTENIIKFLRIQEKYIEELEEELEQIKKFKAKKAKELDSFKNYLMVNCKKMGVKKIETPIGKLVISSSIVCDVYDQEKIPAEFIKTTTKTTTTTSPSKSDITKFLKAGIEVPGARLVIKNTLNIK